MTSTTALRVLARFIRADQGGQEPAKGKGGVPSRWQEWLDATAEGGKKKVPNPNPQTKTQHPQVSFSTALKDKQFFQKAIKEYRKWVGEQKDESKKPAESPSKADSLSANLGVTDKDVESLLKRHKAEFDDITKDMRERVQGWKDMGKSPQGFPHFDSLSAEEQMLVVGGQLAGKLFEQKVVKNKKLHEQIVENWITSSESDEGHKLQGFLAKHGVPGSQPKGEKNDKTDKLRSEGADDKEIEAYLKQVTAFQKAFFKHLGLKEVTLFRGVRGLIDGDPPAKGDPVEIKTREASSFSTSPVEASAFGRQIAYKIPIDNVLLSAVVAPRLHGETEMVVAGGSALTGKVDAPPKSKSAAEAKKPFVVQLDAENEDWLRAKKRKQAAWKA